MNNFLLNIFLSIKTMFLSEDRKRFLKNKDIDLNLNQVWTLPFDVADKYCEPVIISIKAINKTNNTVTYTTNYLKGSTLECSIDEFKTDHELQK